MLDPLVDEFVAADLGFVVSNASLLRASSRVRGYLRQRVSPGTSTITARGPVFRLTERPVVSITSVVDEAGSAIPWESRGSIVTVPSIGQVTVTFEHGYSELPDELAELVCQVAARIEGLSAATALAQGVQQQQQLAGPFQENVTYGWDAWKAQAGLSQGEKDTLDRYWPRLPQIVTVGSPL